MDKLPYPEFATEADEADWLFEHRDNLEAYFAPVSGNAREVLLRQHGLQLPEAIVSVPLSSEDLAKVKMFAASEGLDPGTYLGQVVRESLRDKHAA